MPDWKQIKRVQGVVRQVAEGEARERAEVGFLVEDVWVQEEIRRRPGGSRPPPVDGSG